MTTKSLTYSELAGLLGVKLDSARRTVQRKRWPKVVGNDGKARILVPIESLPSSADNPADNVTVYIRELETRIEGLDGQIAAMRELVTAATQRAETAEMALRLLADRPRRWLFPWRKAG